MVTTLPGTITNSVHLPSSRGCWRLQANRRQRGCGSRRARSCEEGPESEPQEGRSSLHACWTCFRHSMRRSSRRKKKRKKKRMARMKTRASGHGLLRDSGALSTPKLPRLHLARDRVLANAPAAYAVAVAVANAENGAICRDPLSPPPKLHARLLRKPFRSLRS